MFIIQLNSHHANRGCNSVANANAKKVHILKQSTYPDLKPT